MLSQLAHNSDVPLKNNVIYQTIFSNFPPLPSYYTFMGDSFTRHDLFLKYFPPNIPISNVKITTITPKLCHIVFMKVTIANAVESINIFKETGKYSKSRQNFIPPYILNQYGDPHFFLHFWMSHTTYYNIFKFRYNVMGEPFV